MKIAFIYTSPFPAKRGFSAADRRVRDLVRGMQFAGAAVTLCIPKYHQELSVRTHNEDFEIKYSGRKTVRGIKFIDRLFFWVDLYSYISKNDFTTVFLYNTQADCIPFVKLIKRKGIKVIFEICDFHSFDERKSLKTYLATMTESVLPKEADLVITISDFLIEMLAKKSSPTNILKIPILVDSDYFQDTTNVNVSTYKSDDFLISYVGGVWHHQGVGFLMEAFKKVNKLRPDTKLLIAGNYDTLSPNKTDVLSLAKELDILDNVILPGWVGTEEVRSILYASDLLVIAQTNDVFAQAGLPTKLAEYAACRKPILATKVGDVPAYFKDKYNGLLCEPSDVNSMADAILYAVDNPKEMKSISYKAFETANTYFDYKTNGIIIYNKLKSL